MTLALLLGVGFGVPSASSACGGTVVGGHGGDAGAHPRDAMATSHPDTGMKGPSRDAGHESAAVDTSYPASHPPLPTVASGGGPTVAHPVFIAVTFPGDPSAADIVAFTSGIGATTYWSTIASQYGVGPATIGTPVVLTAAEEPPGTGATVADADIQSWLTTQIASGALAGTNAPDTVYAIYFPAGTTITLPIAGQTARSCLEFGGYHQFFQTTDTGAVVTYAVIARCDVFATAGGTLTGVDAITGPASHEYLEAVTDPEPLSNPAYVLPDDGDMYWAVVVGGGEIGDMCAQFPNAFFKPPGFGYTVQRVWSNSAALASHDPCQPDLTSGEVYFNSVAVLPDTATIDGVTAQAVTVPLHGSKTVEVDLYSDGPTAGPWSVQVVDALEFQGSPPALSFSWDKTTGRNGDKLHLTITAESLPSGGVDGFLLLSQLGATQATMSIGMVAVR